LSLLSSQKSILQDIVKARPFNALIKLLESSNDEVKEKAADALADVTKDSDGYFKVVNASSVIQILLQLVKESSPLPIVHSSLRAIDNVFENSGKISSDIIQKTVSVFAPLLHYKDNLVIVRTCKSLASLIGNNNAEEVIQEIIEAGCLHRLIELLSDKELNVIRSVLRVVGYLASGSDRQRKILMDLSLFSKIINLLNLNDDKVLRESLFFVENMAGTQDIDNESLSILIDNYDNADSAIQMECVWAFTKIAKVNPEVDSRRLARFLIHATCVFQEDDELALECLDALGKLFERNQNLIENIDNDGGFDAIQNIRSQQVSDKLEELFDTYNQ